MIEVTSYKCEHCNKTMLDKKKMEKHEANCIKKPKEILDYKFCNSCPSDIKLNCALTGVKTCKK